MHKSPSKRIETQPKSDLFIPSIGHLRRNISPECNAGRMVFASAVRTFGYDAMLRGGLVVIDDRRLRLMVNWLVPCLSRRQVLRMSRDIGEKAAWPRTVLLASTH